jgi:uncharacterized protein
MGLIRFLFLLLIAGAIWFMVKNYLRKQELHQRRESPGPQRVNKIVRCTQCDVHLPEEDAVRDGDDWFCTLGHKRAWLAKKPKP